MSSADRAPERAGLPERIVLLGLPLDLIGLEEAVGRLRGWLAAAGPAGPALTRTVVTLNPEIVVQAETDADLALAIRSADLVTADGVGIVWAAGRLTGRRPDRATGVDLAARLMELEGERLSVFLLGARPGVAERAALECGRRWGVRVAGAHDGYFSPSADAEVAGAVRASGADLVLVGLGAGRQERFCFDQRDRLGARVAIGVGGTIDVLAGEVERAPAWTARLGVEWVWRVVTMRRWSRARRLADFVARVLRERPARA